MSTPQDELFEYLKNILYDPAKAQLDVEKLPPDFRELGEGLKLVEKYLDEMRSYGKALANGDFTVEQPNGENVLAAPLKSVQSILKHISWQTQQVAKGDYSQRLDYMGDFSKAYNQMVETLAAQHERILEEQHRIEQKNTSLQHAQDLVMSMAFSMKRGMVILNLETGEAMFHSDSMDQYTKRYPKTSVYIIEALRKCPEGAHHRRVSWKLTVQGETQGTRAYFDVQSQPVMWEGKHATAHVIENTTAVRRREERLENFAYSDALTGLGNRRYGTDMLEKWHDANINFCLAFIDIDLLKYCNDEFGHNKGDEYIISVGKALREMGEDMMLCRFGGDEFMMAAKNTDEETMLKALEKAREKLILNENFNFPPSFSFGVCLSTHEENISLSEIIKVAEDNMYRYKVNHKINRR